MLHSLCHKVEILNNYCNDTSTLIPQAKEACFEIAITLLSFLSRLVRFMRSDIEYSTPGELHIHGAFLKNQS